MKFLKFLLSQRFNFVLALIVILLLSGFFIYNLYYPINNELMGLFLIPFIIIFVFYLFVFYLAIYLGPKWSDIPNINMVIGSPDRNRDEREEFVVGRASRIAYQVLNHTLALVLILVMFYNFFIIHNHDLIIIFLFGIPIAISEIVYQTIIKKYNKKK